MNQIRIVIVYDNIVCNRDFKTDWGFGCIVDHPKARILFDTGAKPEVLEANLKAATIAPHSIDMVVISHKHWDHKGGALWIAQQNPQIKIYIPQTFSNTLKNELSKSCQNIISVKNNFKIDDHFEIIVSENFWIRELALAVKTSQGSLVLTGCSHTGIHRIASKVCAQTGQGIQALFGGFHLFRSSLKTVTETCDSLKKMNVEKIAPCHCTGEKALTVLKNEFSDHFLEGGVGADFHFSL